MKELRKYQFSEFTDFFYTPQVLEEIGGDARNLSIPFSRIQEAISNTSPECREIITLNARKKRLRGTAILHAHGCSNGKDWCFRCGKNKIRVQDWINSVDSRYSLLVIDSCNCFSQEIHSQKSAVLSPQRAYSGIEYETSAILELCIPKRGYINPYTLESVLAECKKSI